MANQKKQQEIFMFSVIIQSQEGSKKSIREWPTVDIFQIGSDEFDDLIDQERVRLGGMFSDLGDVGHLVSTFKAVLRSVCGEHNYYVLSDESVFVTNSHGKTVASVK